MADDVRASRILIGEPGDGLYIDPPVLRIDDDMYVEADRFMAVQKERDDARRTLALINAAHRAGADVSIDGLLTGAGLTDGEARAMASLVAWGRGEGVRRA